MDYIIKFSFDTISKSGLISGMKGESNITTEKHPDKLKTDKELIGLIAQDMCRKTKKTILSVNITEVIPK